MLLPNDLVISALKMDLYLFKSVLTLLLLLTLLLFSNYSDFLICHRALVKRLLSQGYQVNRLSNTFKKFYGRHTDLVGQYKKNVCQMFADSIS